jgi:hypothetical protein
MFRMRAHSGVVMSLALAAAFGAAAAHAGQEGPTTPAPEKIGNAQTVDEKVAGGGPKAGVPGGRGPERVAEEPKAGTPRGPQVQKVFVIRHADISQLVRVLGIFPAQITFSTHPQLMVLGVSASAAVVAAIEETIKRLDVPPPPVKGVELTGYILDAVAQPGAQTSVPAELESVVTQLKRTFNYTAYRLSDTLIARVRDGAGLEVEALGPAGPNAAARRTHALRAFRTTIALSEGVSVVSLRKLRFTVQIPVPISPTGPGASSYQYKDVGVQADDLDLREGQKVVVGKTGVGDGGDALILVLTAKVVD